MTPCNISLYGSAPDNAGMHINIALTEMDLCMSPAIITTISKIVSNLQNSQVIVYYIRLKSKFYSLLSILEIDSKLCFGVEYHACLGMLAFLT